VDRLDRVSRKYSLINVDNTKVMASDGIRAAYSFRMSNWNLHLPVVKTVHCPMYEKFHTRVLRLTGYLVNWVATSTNH